MRRLSVILLSLLFLLGMTACGSGIQDAETTPASGNETPVPETEDTSEEETKVEHMTEGFETVTPVAENGVYTMSALRGWVKLHGRSRFLSDGALTADLSASGFTLRVDASGGDLTVCYRNNYRLYFAVFVDGTEVLRPLCEKGEGAFSVTLTPGVHTVEVLKETEARAENGAFSEITGISVDGTILEKEPDRDVFIEFIGDSITCGDGSLGTYASGEVWSLADHSATHGFAYLAAQELGADYALVAKGGIGFIKESGGATIDPFYDTFCIYRDRTPYTPARTPDLIVLEIGANDGSVSTEEEYYNALTAFIAKLRALYGKEIPIVWFGSSDRNYGAMRRYMLEVKKEDPNLYATQYKCKGLGSAALATQSAGHPSAEEQETIAEALVKLIREKKLVP